jgi:hypothetical protein
VAKVWANLSVLMSDLLLVLVCPRDLQHTKPLLVHTEHNAPEMYCTSALADQQHFDSMCHTYHSDPEPRSNRKNRPLLVSVLGSVPPLGLVWALVSVRRAMALAAWWALAVALVWAGPLGLAWAQKLVLGQVAAWALVSVLASVLLWASPLVCVLVLR